MANEEQQAAEYGDLVGDVLEQTREVNVNLGAILNRTDTVIRRQNWLTVLFILSMCLNIAHLALGFSQQQLQQASKAQLTAMDYGREELLAVVKAAKNEVAALQGSMEDIRGQLDSIPTVTTDKAGRINLELPLDPTAQKTVSEQPQVSGDTRAPDKLVIPLRPQQSRLAN